MTFLNQSEAFRHMNRMAGDDEQKSLSCSSASVGTCGCRREPFIRSDVDSCSEADGHKRDNGCVSEADSHSFPRDGSCQMVCRAGDEASEIHKLECALACSREGLAFSNSTSEVLTSQMSYGVCDKLNRHQNLTEANAGFKDSSCNHGFIPNGDGCENLDSLSPRISFSRDFALGGLGASSMSHSIAPPRLSSEKRKWAKQNESVEFEFHKHLQFDHGPSTDKRSFMLSADELFQNGKLLPVPYPSRAACYDDLCLPSSLASHADRPTSAMTVFDRSESRPKARHLSFELMPSLDESSLSSLSTEVILAAVTCAHSSPSSPSSKYCKKLKQIFKLKKISTDPLHNGELETDASPTCKVPIFPRSLWPFSSNVSFRESKEYAPLNCREACVPPDVTALRSSERNAQAMEWHLQEHEASYGQDTGEDQVLSGLSCASSSNESGKNHGRGLLKMAKSMTAASRHFNKASVSKRGQTRSSGARMNVTSKMALTDLERFTEKKKKSTDGSKLSKYGRPYSAAFKVSPVLNVAMYKGGFTSNRNSFGLSNFFSRRSRKPPESATKEKINC
ncbi:hypothetical protein KP509_31G066000 [Ceratopteris richardii]|uniref:Uncharacterized protein n=1 Tax=Ceratopteris richardii TaxID=49495 RepID=A0A8T2QZ31_CERRI|nr:hypothetical protein KP509_31G066000 [Ceratopteris richardii]